MFGLSGSELLFLGGIAVMALAVLSGFISVVVFRFTGRNLREKLEREYGKPWE